MKKIILIAFISCLAGSSLAQQKSAFDSLVNVLEKKFEVRFYYDSKFTDGLDIIPSSGKLEKVLKTTLEGSGLNFYIDKKRRVFIFGMGILAANSLINVA